MQVAIVKNKDGKEIRRIPIGNFNTNTLIQDAIKQCGSNGGQVTIENDPDFIDLFNFGRFERTYEGILKK